MAAPDHAQHPVRRFFLRRRGRPHMGVGDGGAKTPTAEGASVRSGHLRRGPGFIDEDQVVGPEVELSLEPLPAPRQDIGAVLLGRVRGLF